MWSSKQFTVAHVTNMRMASMELTRGELDMALLGQISACTHALHPHMRGGRIKTLSGGEEEDIQQLRPPGVPTVSPRCRYVL